MQLQNLAQRVILRVSKQTQTRYPQPEHYSCWFEYFDSIDLRRHLQEIERITLIEASLEKADGMVSVAADNLKLRRTTLIEKMKKYLIEKSV